MKTKLSFLVLLIVSTCFYAVAQGRGGARGAAPAGNATPPTSPVTGNSTNGKALYYNHGCYGCHGFNGETGEAIFNGGADTVTINKFQTPIAAKGKIFVAAGNQLVAFAP